MKPISLYDLPLDEKTLFVASGYYDIGNQFKVVKGLKISIEIFTRKDLDLEAKSSYSDRKLSVLKF